MRFFDEKYNKTKKTFHHGMICLFFEFSQKMKNLEIFIAFKKQKKGVRTFSVILLTEYSR